MKYKSACNVLKFENFYLQESGFEWLP